MYFIPHPVTPLNSGYGGTDKVISEILKPLKMLLLSDCIIKKKILNLPDLLFLTADRMSLATLPSSNGWTIPLKVLSNGTGGGL
jgi:hypothetical protein